MSTIPTLTLAVFRGPNDSAPERRQLRGGELSLGRGPDNGWVLPDPERHLSKRHCTIGWHDASWQLSDLSTNGTFLNGEADPVGLGQRRALRDGDRLRLGAYAFEIRIDEPPLAEPWIAPGRHHPFLPEPSLAFRGPVQPDHTPGIEDAFRPPRPNALLGEDWDLDLPAMPAGPPEQPAPVPELRPAPSAPSHGDADPLRAFLRGAGVPETRLADPEAAMEALGRAFRALVQGLRETLIARAAVKSEFRIEQTLIRARGNNPLKFAATDDDALSALLGERQAGMAPADAVSEALRDIRLHELATMSAMQSAVRGLLRELAPEKLRDGAAASLLPAQRKNRAWDAFEALHARMTQALSDDFDSVFGRAFARAYEQALRETGSGDNPA